MRATYEAGPTGYGLARALAAAEIELLGGRPGKIPRGATDRVKTDRRDAEHLVRLLLAGKLSPVRVPGPPEEAMRDLVRAREDLRMDLMRARHRLAQVPACATRSASRGRATTGPSATCSWLSKLSFEDPAAQATFEDYLGGVEALLHRRSELERRIEGLIPASPWAREVGRLRCLRGIDTLTAVGLCAEIGDFARFGKAGQLMSYLGLVPSEHSSGESRRLGSITKSGSRHGRRLLVEAAWHYRNPPRVGREIERRQAGPASRGNGGGVVGAAAPAPHLLAAAQAQQALDGDHGRRRSRLAGFCWAIALIE